VSRGVVENILGNSAPLHFYEQGSWGPLETENLAKDIGGWHNPGNKFGRGGLKLSEASVLNRPDTYARLT